MTQKSPHTTSRPQPVATAETRPFWEGAAEGKLVLRRCCACGRLAAPLAPRCVDCLGDSFELATLSGRAALDGRTKLHLRPLPDHEGPLVIVECALAEDPRIVLIALDQNGCTEMAAPGTPLQLHFPPTEGDTRFAVVQSTEAQP